MSNDTHASSDGITIDKSKVERLTAWLVIKEKNNIRTKELNDAQMVAAIKKQIEVEAKWYSNQSN